MKKVYIYCEGQTEEAFVNNVLYPYFFNNDIYVCPIICSTKRTASKKYKGGILNYGKMKHELPIICKSHPHEIVTTMFDYYGMPDDTPGIDCSEADIFKRIETIEKAISDDMGQANLIVNLMLHEFESVLFSDPQCFNSITDDSDAVLQLQRMRDEANSPEHINNSVETAPSKRIISAIPDYAKIRDGLIVSTEIGMNKMLSECKHFAAWIEKIHKFNLSNRE